MAKARRVLTERELDEQIRLGLKNELLAYIHSAIPKSQKTDDLIKMWQQVNVQIQLLLAERKLKMRFLEMLSKNDRESEVKRLRQSMLPSD